MLSIVRFPPLLPSIDVKGAQGLARGVVWDAGAPRVGRRREELFVGIVRRQGTGGVLPAHPAARPRPGDRVDRREPKGRGGPGPAANDGGWGVGRRGYLCDRLSACPFRSLFFLLFVVVVWRAFDIAASIPPLHRPRPGFVVVQYMLLLACLRTQSVVDGIDLEVDLADVFEYSSSGLHVVGCVALCALFPPMSPLPHANVYSLPR